MAGHLALVGGGEFTEGCTFDAALLEASGASEVLVVPTGAAYEHPHRLVERAAGWFDRLGVQVKGLDLLARPSPLRGGEKRAPARLGGSRFSGRLSRMGAPRGRRW